MGKPSKPLTVEVVSDSAAAIGIRYESMRSKYLKPSRCLRPEMDVDDEITRIYKEVKGIIWEYTWTKAHVHDNTILPNPYHTALNEDVDEMATRARKLAKKN